MRRNASFVSSLVFISTMVGATWLARSEALAVYSLSFWHYGLYWLAYRYGAVSLAVFKRDAVTMKAVALALLLVLAATGFAFRSVLP